MISIQPKSVRDKIKFNVNGGPTLFATWFGCGLLKPAPGTWGTLGGMIAAIPLIYFCSIETVLILFGFITCLGYWSCMEFEKISGDHDSSMIVVDEVVGVWITLFLIPFTWVNVILAFVLFRFFDILKPWPIRYLDKKVPGAFGVMIDDVVAGLFAGLCILGLNYVGLG